MSGFSYQIGRAFGIPLRVHVTLLLFAPFAVFGMASGTGLPLFLSLAAFCGFFASIVLHELGHALVARRYGCGTHQILLLPIGGIAQLAHLPEHPGTELRIALAGPLVSLALALAGVLLGGAATAAGLAGPGVLLSLLGYMNLALAVFNLLPSFPMDGGRVLRAALTPRIGRLAATRLAARIGKGMALFFGLLAILQFHLVLLGVAVFIYWAAEQEYRMVRRQEAQRRAAATRPWSWFARPAVPVEGEEVIIGPPPYAPDRPPTVARRRRRGGGYSLADLLGLR